MFWPPPLPILLQLEKALGQRVAAARCKELGWEAECQGAWVGTDGICCRRLPCGRQV